MEEWIKALARFPHRMSGTAPNAAAARTIRSILESLGWSVREGTFRVPGRLATGLALNIAVLGIVFFAVRSRMPALVLYALALASFWGELSTSFHWLRRVIPPHEDRNIEARLAPEGEAAETVVVLAHYDSAPTGLLYNSGASDRVSARLTRMPYPFNRFFLPPFAAAVGLGAALAIRPFASLSAPSAVLTCLGAGVLLVMFVNVLEIALSRPSPGGNDNGSGVLALLELARRLAGDPPKGKTVHLLATGAEEAGFFGIKAFLRDHPELDRGRTLFINIDSIGGGRLHWAADEGCCRRIRTPREGLARLDRLEAEGKIPVLPRSSILSPTDATALGPKGWRFLTLIGLRENGAPPGYHRAADTFDRIDPALLLSAADIVETIVRSAGG